MGKRIQPSMQHLEAPVPVVEMQCHLCYLTKLLLRLANWQWARPQQTLLKESKKQRRLLSHLIIFCQQDALIRKAMSYCLHKVLANNLDLMAHWRFTMPPSHSAGIRNIIWFLLALKQVWIPKCELSICIYENVAFYWMEALTLGFRS